ncbi:MAG: glycosyltransferase family 4 protein [Desulfobacterales bacterium]|nr:glycosyltransferase family 4 protein [Desulfobacterales bacterium]
MPKVCILGTNNKAHTVRMYGRMCTHLVKYGFEVILTAQEDGNNHFCDGIIFYPLIKYQPSTQIKPLKRLKLQYKSFIVAIKSNADIFQFYSPEFITVALWLRRITKKPVIFDCVEDFLGYIRQRQGIPILFRPLIYNYFFYEFIKAAKGLDAIITPDQGTADFFLPYAKRVEVFHNFPVISLFPDKISEHTPIYDLVFHGGLNSYFLQMMIAIDDDLVKRGRHLKWYLFGDIVSSEKEWFINELSKRSINTRFHIGNPVMQTQVVNEVQKARIGVIPLPDLPKYHNNIPQKLFEYMAMRMPSVVSNLPPIHPFTKKGDFAFCADANNSDSFAEAIIRLIDNPELCKKMGANGRLLIEREFNWENEFTRMLSLYHSLIKK